MAKQNNNLLIGAAMAAGLLGTLTTLLLPRKRTGWTEQAKEIADKIVTKRKETTKNRLIGGVAGGLVGVTTALLFAPKSGSELIKDMSKPFTETAKHTATPAKKAVKKISKQKASHGPAHHSPAGQAKAAAKPKRTAATAKKAPKHAAPIRHESVANEAKA
ncbi:YtxH domain-containing protein [Candidatus Protochlamydia phocaeensis]|uniref:YtxH domain-containing protein n=1 Tax=Candidatus Protochlamydia phocaeensis TaxID=1414722 RepID=UPI000AF52124|nr:YtxH domain-containing protein [Candidatus Protochlamydia phocaeensis]